MFHYFTHVNVNTLSVLTYTSAALIIERDFVLYYMIHLVPRFTHLTLFFKDI